MRSYLLGNAEAGMSVLLTPDCGDKTVAVWF